MPIRFGRAQRWGQSMLFGDSDTHKFLDVVRKLKERERRKAELARKAKQRVRGLRKTRDQ